MEERIGLFSRKLGILDGGDMKVLYRNLGIVIRVFFLLKNSGFFFFLVFDSFIF